MFLPHLFPLVALLPEQFQIHSLPQPQGGRARADGDRRRRRGHRQ